MQETEKLWILTRKILICIISVMGIGGCLLAFTPKIKQMRDYQQTNQSLEAEIDLVEQRTKELQEKQNRFKTDPDFVEKIAHEIGYAHTNEIIYHFPDDSDNKDLSLSL